jgi:hypothetical protein
MTVIDCPTPPRLSGQLGLYRYDPLGFVKFVFPWGRPGTVLAGPSAAQAMGAVMAAAGVPIGRQAPWRCRSSPTTWPRRSMPPASACAMQSIEREPSDSKTTGGKGGKGGNL